MSQNHLKFDKWMKQHTLGMKPDPLIQTKQVKTRLCLKCRESFQSQGLFICPSCTVENENLHLSKQEIRGVRSQNAGGGKGVKKGSDGG